MRSLDRLSANGKRLRSRLIRNAPDRAGYRLIWLHKDRVRKMFIVHRLVLTAFVGPCPEGMEGCHNNGDPGDNRLENLRWDTKSANCLEKVTHGTHNCSRKTHCKRRHLLEGNNLESRTDGRRACKACSRARERIKRHPELGHGEEILQMISDNYYREICR